MDTIYIYDELGARLDCQEDEAEVQTAGQSTSMIDQEVDIIPAPQTIQATSTIDQEVDIIPAPQIFQATSTPDEEADVAEVPEAAASEANEDTESMQVAEVPTSGAAEDTSMDVTSEGPCEVVSLTEVKTEIRQLMRTRFEENNDWPDYVRALMWSEFAQHRLKLKDYNQEYEALWSECHDKGEEITPKMEMELLLNYMLTKYCPRNKQEDVFLLYFRLSNFLKYHIPHYRKYIELHGLSPYTAFVHSKRVVYKVEDEAVTVTEENIQLDLDRALALDLFNWFYKAKSEKSLPLDVSYDIEAFYKQVGEPAPLCMVNLLTLEETLPKVAAKAVKDYEYWPKLMKAVIWHEAMHHTLDLVKYNAFYERVARQTFEKGEEMTVQKQMDCLVEYALKYYDWYVYQEGELYKDDEDEIDMLAEIQLEGEEEVKKMRKNKYKINLYHLVEFLTYHLPNYRKFTEEFGVSPWSAFAYLHRVKHEIIDGKLVVTEKPRKAGTKDEYGNVLPFKKFVAHPNISEIVNAWEQVPKNQFSLQMGTTLYTAKVMKILQIKRGARRSKRAGVSQRDKKTKKEECRKRKHEEVHEEETMS
ncbi:ORF12 [Ranid herpesvirus 2]|uniref:ORF12 n=1 Tax=Ranid herpesvirus 2 TaxID=389214 RepID=Q14W94_9VIRU|nr:ORF12 [Ranid herpesvirus 2]ABG25568.1 ORF12 [Ranid herpesvirus 2]